MFLTAFSLERVSIDFEDAVTDLNDATNEIKRQASIEQSIIEQSIIEPALKSYAFIDVNTSIKSTSEIKTLSRNA